VGTNYITSDIILILPRACTYTYVHTCLYCALKPVVEFCCVMTEEVSSAKNCSTFVQVLFFMDGG
jgi:hypothetical protein